jgi:hypothetical protein
MKKQWQKRLITILIWIVAEIFLNFLGLDNLADYSEFVFQKNEIIFVSQTKCNVIDCLV